MWWIWFLYAILFVVLIFVSDKLGKYIDALDKKTKLSGAFLGGVLLAAVTSLPELFTSITSVLLDEPGMCLGDIMGSNLFDITILGIVMIFYCKRILNRKITKSVIIYNIFTFSIAFLILLMSLLQITIIIPGININILTPLLLILYIISCSATKVDDKGGDDDIKKIDEKNLADALTVKQIVVRFILMAIVLVCASIAITYITEFIANTYNLGKGLAGALLLGIATSIPEIIATITLIRVGNTDAGMGNMLGSCTFNFFVLALADIFYIKGTVFLTDVQSIILSACLMISTIFFAIYYFLRKKRKLCKSLWLSISLGMLIVISYLAFLILSSIIV